MTDDAIKQRLITRSIAISSMVDFELNEGKRFELYRERKDIRDQLLLLSGGTGEYDPPTHQTPEPDSNTANLRRQQDEEYQQSVRDDAARIDQERVEAIRTALAVKRAQKTEAEQAIVEAEQEAVRGREKEERQAALTLFQTTFVAPAATEENVIMIKVVFVGGRKASAFRSTDRVLDLFLFSLCAYANANANASASASNTNASANDDCVLDLEKCTLKSTMQTLVLSPTDVRTLGDLDLGKSGVFHLQCSE